MRRQMYARSGTICCSVRPVDQKEYHLKPVANASYALLSPPSLQYRTFRRIYLPCWTHLCAGHNHLDLTTVSAHQLLEALNDLGGVSKTAVLGEDLEQVPVRYGKHASAACPH